MSPRRRSGTLLLALCSRSWSLRMASLRVLLLCRILRLRIGGNSLDTPAATGPPSSTIFGTGGSVGSSAGTLNDSRLVSDAIDELGSSILFGCFPKRRCILLVCLASFRRFSHCTFCQGAVSLNKQSNTLPTSRPLQWTAPTFSQPVAVASTHLSSVLHSPVCRPLGAEHSPAAVAVPVAEELHHRLLSTPT